MIEESLLKSNFIGKDGFIWWIGQVADPKVWRNEKTRIDNGKDAWGWGIGDSDSLHPDAQRKGRG